MKEALAALREAECYYMRATLQVLMVFGQPLGNQPGF
jgi:hypothetical protein